MNIETLKLTNFRNHLDKTISFNDGINLIVGENGSGKTNILEGIYLIATAKSPRSHYDRDLINYEQSFCTINANVFSHGSKEALELQVIKNENYDHASTKKAKVNKTAKAIAYFTGIFNAVLFTPEDIEIITGTPSHRRRYLDMVLSQTDPKYKKEHSLYLKAIKQRNKLLEMIKENGTGWDQMDYWNSQILEYGQSIQQKRTDFFESVGMLVAENIKTLDKPSSVIELKYLKNEISEERLKKHRDHEVAAKTTLVGPHRDDFEIYFNGHNIGIFGSRGQQRTILLGLKLSEIEFIEGKTGERPVLLLDDIFSELDEKHKERVVDTIKKQQTIVTSAELIRLTGFNEIQI